MPVMAGHIKMSVLWNRSPASWKENSLSYMMENVLKVCYLDIFWIPSFAFFSWIWILLQIFLTEWKNVLSMMHQFWDWKKFKVLAKCQGKFWSVQNLLHNVNCNFRDCANCKLLLTLAVSWTNLLKFIFYNFYAWYDYLVLSN